MNTGKFKLSTHILVQHPSAHFTLLMFFFLTIGQMIKACIHVCLYSICLCISTHVYCFVNFCLHKENVEVRRLSAVQFLLYTIHNKVLLNHIFKNHVHLFELTEGSCSNAFSYMYIGKVYGGKWNFVNAIRGIRDSLIMCHILQIRILGIIIFFWPRIHVLCFVLLNY